MQHEGEGEDEEDGAINSKREPVSFDEVNALVVQLKSLQVQAIELGKEYHAVYLALGDASNSIWSIYCKHQNIKKAKKQSTAKQTSMKHFLKKVNLSSKTAILHKSTLSTKLRFLCGKHGNFITCASQ